MKNTIQSLFHFSKIIQNSNKGCTQIGFNHVLNPFHVSRNILKKNICRALSARDIDSYHQRYDLSAL